MKSSVTDATRYYSVCSLFAYTYTHSHFLSEFILCLWFSSFNLYLTHNNNNTDTEAINADNVSLILSLLQLWEMLIW